MQAIGIDHLFGKGQFATDTDGIMPAGVAVSQTGLDVVLAMEK